MKKFAVSAVVALAVVSASGVFANSNMNSSNQAEVSLAGEDTVEVDTVAQDLAMVIMNDTVE